MLAAVDLGFVVRAARPEGFIKARDGREDGREAGEFAGGVGLRKSVTEA